MSDTVLKLIPTDPCHVPPELAHGPALTELVQLTRGFEPEVRVHDTLQFIDPGEWLEAVICPGCGTRLAMDWSPEHAAYFEWYSDLANLETEAGADSVEVTMPCCRAIVPFTALNVIDAGFARFELSIWNPDIDFPLSSEHQARLETILRCPLKQVWARY